MVAILDAKRLTFADNPGETKITGRVILDDKAPFAITLRWLPQSLSWIMDMQTAQGIPIVNGAWIRDRVDALLGISTAGRPKGAIMSYDPKNRGEPQLDAWTTGGAGLWYIPAGLNPYDFTVYRTAIA